MKRFTLLRHAKSSWADSGLTDHDRPLAPRGLRDAPRMGRRLAELGLEPALVLSSTATRARQTAELVAQALACPRIATDGTIYLASPATLLDVLMRQSDAIGELIVVGHNPGFTDFANRLLPELKLHNLPTAGAVAIDADASSWSELGSAHFTLLFCESPKSQFTSQKQ